MKKNRKKIIEDEKKKSLEGIEIALQEGAMIFAYWNADNVRVVEIKNHKVTNGNKSSMVLAMHESDVFEALYDAGERFLDLREPDLEEFNLENFNKKQGDHSYNNHLDRELIDMRRLCIKKVLKDYVCTLSGYTVLSRPMQKEIKNTSLKRCLEEVPNASLQSVARMRAVSTE